MPSRLETTTIHHVLQKKITWRRVYARLDEGSGWGVVTRNASWCQMNAMRCNILISAGFWKPVWDVLGQRNSVCMSHDAGYLKVNTSQWILSSLLRITSSYDDRIYITALALYTHASLSSIRSWGMITSYLYYCPLLEILTFFIQWSRYSMRRQFDDCNDLSPIYLLVMVYQSSSIQYIYIGD